MVWKFSRFARNREGIISPKGNSWGKTTVYKILTNEAYIGTLVWGRSSNRDLPPVRVESALPVIIDQDTFQQVQALLKERAATNVYPKKVVSNYLLSGLAKCGYCGKNLIGQDAKGGKFHYYVCGTLQKKGTGSCSATYTRKDKLEQAVIRKIKDHILTYENLKELVNLTNEELDTAAGDYRERLNIISAEINTVNQPPQAQAGTAACGTIGTREPSVRQEGRTGRYGDSEELRRRAKKYA